MHEDEEKFQRICSYCGYDTDGDRYVFRMRRIRIGDIKGFLYD